ncbi:MAG: FGGY family carbohydrate kinase [Leptolinea sp.]
MADLESCILAVDIGTSSLKGVVYDCLGGVVASVTHRYPAIPQPQQLGWAETDPHIWWEALLVVISQLKQTRNDFYHLKVMILTGQMHTAVLLDQQGNVLPPTILWLDRRAANETVELQKAFQLPAYHLNSTYTLPKLVWLARNQPDVIKKARHLLWPKDYIRYLLTGEICTDFTEAGGAALLDWDRMDWAKERLEWAGISPSILPPLRQPTDLAGKLRPEIAKQLGINPDTKVLVGVGDVLALVTAAPSTIGQVTCSVGSSSMVFYPLASGQNCTDSQSRIYNYPLLPYRLFGGVSSTSGASITWAAKTFFGDLPFSEAIDLALQVSPGAGGLFFLPFLSGERSPFWNDALRGSFYGLTLNHDRNDMLRSVLEGVTFSLRYLLDIFIQNGVSINKIALAGGATTIPGLPQIIANVCQYPVAIYSGQETVTQGLYAYACQVLEPNVTFEQALQRTFQQPPELTKPELETGEIYNLIYYQYSQLAEFANGVLK